MKMVTPCLINVATCTENMLPWTAAKIIFYNVIYKSIVAGMRRWSNKWFTQIRMWSNRWV